MITMKAVPSFLFKNSKDNCWGRAPPKRSDLQILLTKLQAHQWASLQLRWPAA